MSSVYITMTIFLGVYIVLYDYEAQTDEELSVKEGDLLYLLEKSEVDDWWTVKKRVIGSDQDEPVGLVPSNYIEEAQVNGSVVALYDYAEVQNANEELVFHEGDVFSLYDDRDPDWFLVKNSKTGEVGFVPGNYVEKQGSAPAASASASTSTPAPVPLSELPPPPQRVDLKPATQSPEKHTSAASMSSPTTEVQKSHAHAEPAAPAMPQRPSTTDHQTSYGEEPSSQRKSRAYDNYEDDEDDEDIPPLPSRSGATATTGAARSSSSGAPSSTVEHVWSVNEIDGRKKRKAKLTVSADRIHFFSAKTKVDQEWGVADLISYDNEKKHLFLEFKNPYINLELHTGSTDTANEIIGVLGEIKGAHVAVGLREVKDASRPVLMKKRAKVIYDFFANADDELTVREGEYVNILDDKTSKDWYMCESVETNKRGIVPAQFVQTRKSGSGSQGGKDVSPSKQRTRSRSNTTRSMSSAGNQNLPGSWKEDADQDVSKKKSKTGGFFSKKKKTESKTSSSSSQHADKEKDFPDPKKVRIWVDRTGTFKVEAQFLGCVDGKINLHKVNGVKIAVAADKLSEDDILYVERLTGMSMEKYKPRSKSTNGDSSVVNQERERRRKLKERERELEERERDRQLREQELKELQRTRALLEQEREKMRQAQDKELPPVQPPRPGSEGSKQLRSVPSTTNKPDYDWFEFFLNCGVDVNNCQRYTINFEREQISEEILQDIDPTLLRNLGLREGDILRVMKYLDNKYGRKQEASPSTGLFTEADGTLKVNHTGAANSAGVSHNLLPAEAPASKDDDAWTVRPAAKAAETSNKSHDFSGSLQDLLDLKPLKPKKKEAPAPDVKHLEPVSAQHTSKPEESVAENKTGTSLVPLDPFKTGGNNLIPIATGGIVMMPVATGGLVPFQATGGFLPMQRTGGLVTSQSTGFLPLQRTGGLVAPQTTFGMHPTGTVLPVQKTANGLIPANTGGLIPQTTFGLQQSSTFTGNLNAGPLPLQRTGGGLPQTSFGAQPLQPTTTFGNQFTGGANIQPVNTFGNQLTGGAMGMQPQTAFGNQLTGGAMNMQPQTTFGNQLTGGMNMLPQTSFGNQLTGGMNMQPQTTFGNQFTGGAMNMQPQPNLGNQLTGGQLLQQSQISFNNQLTGGANMPQQFGTSIPQTSFGALQPTGGFQPQSSFGLNLQRTGGMNAGPQTSFNNQTSVNQVTTSFQNMGLSQQPLQNQPTGFGFGNGPQAQQQRQANIYNASADNPFGF